MSQGELFDWISIHLGSKLSMDEANQHFWGRINLAEKHYFFRWRQAGPPDEYYAILRLENSEGDSSWVAACESTREEMARWLAQHIKEELDEGYYPTCTDIKDL